MNDVWDNLLEDYKKNAQGKQLLVTGHSLGGAVAQIIGMWLHERGRMFKFSLTDHQKLVLKFCLEDNPLIGVSFALAILFLLLLLGLIVIQDFL